MKRSRREFLRDTGCCLTAAALLSPIERLNIISNNSVPIETLLLKPSRIVKFTTHEGTNLSVDVSPDGRTIVFDLLGGLYVLPINGGRARHITEGLAIDRQPRYSPDGSRILFLSDRTGEDAVWMCDANGANARSIVTAPHTTSIAFNFTDLIWLPDVNYGDAFLLAMKYLATPHRWGYKLAAFDTRGRPLEKPRLGEGPTAASAFPSTRTPALSAKDASGNRAIYATEVISDEQSSLGRALQIVQIAPATGARTRLTNEPGSAVAPVASPDGRYLIYATTRPTSKGLATGLKLRNLRNNAVSWLVAEVEPSQHSSGLMVSEGHALLPHMAFTPDGRYLIAAYHGKLWRISIPSGRATQIPFAADVEKELGPLLRFPRRINDSEVTARIVRDVRPSPDGKWLAFTALDRIWVLRKGETQPHQVTMNALAPGAMATEHTATWSPDGQYLAFCTWTEHGGHIWRVPARLVTSGPVSHSKVERLTPEPNYYDKLVYTPDGAELVFIHARWQEALRSQDLASSFKAPSAQPELAVMQATGGSLRTLMPLEPRALSQTPGYGWPHFSRRDPKSVFLFSGTTLWSVVRSGHEPARVFATVAGIWPGCDVLLSPNGDTAVIAQFARSVLTFVAVPSVTEPVKLSVPPDFKQDKSLSPFGGDGPWWSPDGALTYTMGYNYFVNDRPTEIIIRVPADRPGGTALLSNARVLTMGAAGILEHGDVLVRDNRIAAVGPHGSLDVPDSVTRIDVTGKTLLPGYVLTHEHVFEPHGVHVPRLWSYLAGLAFGVTTIHDPQGNSFNRFSYADVLETGALLGPRHLSSGKAVEAWPLDSLQETEQLAQRYARYYHSDTLKERGEGQRLVRQWLAIAAKEEQLTSVAHWHEDLESHVLDGYSGLEHASFIPLYDDVLQLIARSGSVYTPTTMLASLTGPALHYFNAHNPFDCNSDDRLRRFASRSGCHFILDGTRGLAGEHPGNLEEKTFVQEARSAAKLVAAGGHVAIGTDASPFWGLPAHWEMWALAMGGMTPAQLLHSATRTGAEALGLNQDLGSIEVGKLADLQVLDRNPLEDIHNTLSVSQVMRNGRLYETRTLDQVWPDRRPFQATPDDKPWWQVEWPECETAPGGCNCSVVDSTARVTAVTNFETWIDHTFAFCCGMSMAQSCVREG